MKKGIKRCISVMILGCALSLILTACAVQEPQQTVKTKEDKIVEQWIHDVTEEYDYESQFDSSIMELYAWVIADYMAGDFKFHVFYSDDTSICFVCKDEDKTGKNNVLELRNVDGSYKACMDLNTFERYHEYTCPDCSGEGGIVVGEKIENGSYDCPNCGGTGWMQNQTYAESTGWMNQPTMCSNCGGTGECKGLHSVSKHKICQTCDGWGVIDENEND